MRSQRSVVLSIPPERMRTAFPGLGSGVMYGCTGFWRDGGIRLAARGMYYFVRQDVLPAAVARYFLIPDSAPGPVAVISGSPVPGLFPPGGRSQFPDNLPDHLFEIPARAPDGDPGVLPVQRHPLVVHVPQALARGKDDPPARDIPEPSFHLRKGDLQVHDHAVLIQVLHRLPFQDHAAASGNDGVLHVEGEDRLLLGRKEPVRPFRIDDLLQAPARPLLDHDVGVDEGHAQRLCEDDAHGALACAGHAGEDDVVHGCTGYLCVRGYEGWWPVAS